MIYELNTPTMVLCPFCKEEIQRGATKCIHCKSNLSVSEGQISSTNYPKDNLIAYELNTPSTVLCPFCKEEIQRGATKCIHCKSNLSLSESHISSTNYPIDNLTPEIRHNLRKYNELVPMHCLECGYIGQMGVVGRRNRWYFSWWILIPLAFSGIGTIPFLILLIMRSATSKHKVKCPVCNEKLIETN
ncbi:MAG: hypothetical protein ACOYMF_16600 [Bacteroidales bacterium]